MLIVWTLIETITDWSSPSPNPNLKPEKPKWTLVAANFFFFFLILKTKQNGRANPYSKPSTFVIKEVGGLKILLNRFVANWTELASSHSTTIIMSVGVFDHSISLPFSKGPNPNLILFVFFFWGFYLWFAAADHWVQWERTRCDGRKELLCHCQRSAPRRSASDNSHWFSANFQNSRSPFYRPLWTRHWFPDLVCLTN